MDYCIKQYELYIVEQLLSRNRHWYCSVNPDLRPGANRSYRSRGGHIYGYRNDDNHLLTLSRE